MRSLLGERFAPITSSIGFLRADLTTAVSGFASWEQGLGREVSSVDLRGSLPEVLPLLEPLTGGGVRRHLFVAAGDWTAYFNCFILGSDTHSTIHVLSYRLRCAGLRVACVPHTHSRAARTGRYGAVQFQLLAPGRSGSSESVRVIEAVNDGGRWTWDARGEPQPFEAPERYEAARVRDRFTSDMLEEYCNALGVEVFNADAYGPAAVMVSTDERMPPRYKSLSLSERQAELNITPGAVDSLPG